MLKILKKELLYLYAELKGVVSSTVLCLESFSRQLNILKETWVDAKVKLRAIPEISDHEELKIKIRAIQASAENSKIY